MAEYKANIQIQCSSTRLHREIRIQYARNVHKSGHRLMWQIMPLTLMPAPRIQKAIYTSGTSICIDSARTPTLLPKITCYSPLFQIRIYQQSM